LRLGFNLAVNRKGKPDKQQRSQKIVDKDFDTFARLHALKITTSLQKPVTILGIDPGTLFMGYSVIEADRNTFTVKTIDVLKLSSKKDHYERLQMIHSRITELVDEFHPDQFAIEAPFFGKNVQSMLKLGRAQGVAIAAAMQSGIPVTEYSPKKVKQSITGNGNAGKEQVWKMLQHVLQLPNNDIKYMDASDALAVALCHHYQTASALQQIKSIKSTSAPKAGKAKGWDAFVAKNPGRVR
jgi:crossover junction endodeoxyribonuclease RuvC